MRLQTHLRPRSPRTVRSPDRPKTSPVVVAAAAAAAAAERNRRPLAGSSRVAAAAADAAAAERNRRPLAGSSRSPNRRSKPLRTRPAAHERSCSAFTPRGLLVAGRGMDVGGPYCNRKKQLSIQHKKRGRGKMQH